MGAIGSNTVHAFFHSVTPNPSLPSRPGLTCLRFWKSPNNEQLSKISVSKERWRLSDKNLGRWNKLWWDSNRLNDHKRLHFSWIQQPAMECLIATTLDAESCDLWDNHTDRSTNLMLTLYLSSNSYGQTFSTIFSSLNSICSLTLRQASWYGQGNISVRVTPADILNKFQF